ncbi:MAG: excinuclease ABC subunit UvrA [Bdellovibrionales bacterium]|nr:excinuclease ABC subunit UvrA [Bdellovibrionales bacterium]
MKEEFQGITIKNARAHNLKGINLQIPRNKLTVITGLSGSGKSTIAFDTIYAEGQRRYIESLSAYARNFMEQLEKPLVDSITGLSPSIAIDQKSISTNPRSTVGTVTEIYDFLRLLYARVGAPNCPTHHVPVVASKPEQIVEEVLKLPKNTKYFIMAPMAQGEKGEYLAEFQKWIKKGFVKAKVDGAWIDLDKAKKLEKHKRHDIDLVIDKLVNDPKFTPRLRDSINKAVSLAKGLVTLEVVGQKPKIYSIHRSCPICAFSFPDMEPRFFSFNNPRGACENCHGMGVVGLADEEYVDTDDDGEETTPALQVCDVCKGLRLKKSSLNVFIEGQNIAELSKMAADELRDFLVKVQFEDREKLISEKIIKQIVSRLDYMIRVGTGYLSLDRPTRTLSGGEVQRIRLATQVGSSLIGVLYVLDEPSIGLHPRDHARLLDILKELRDRGNTVILVEHDEETIRSADHVIDIGPRAGRLGGEVMGVGTLSDIEKNKNSLTGQYLSGKVKVKLPTERRKGSGEKLKLIGASGNNLKNVNLEIPLGTLCGITGVSGSGKSTLIIDTLYRIFAQKLNKSTLVPSPFEKIIGDENIDRIIQINQKPIGRTPRSTPSTYVGLYSLIRDLFANLPESKIRGYKPGQFSFNVKGGRCEGCEGGGLKKVEMHFLSDVYVTCDVCMGARYNRETRSIRYRDKSISDVLAMTVEEALVFFKNHPIIHRKLETLNRVGLDYLTLGQSSTTLSGGEAQRIKLSKELSKRGTGKTLYILDEPTTGLHFEDIRKLIDLLQELAAQGNTVVVIEHNLDVIKCCDWVVDLGPDGARAGGERVASGTPEFVIKNKKSITGQYLAAAILK